MAVCDKCGNEYDKTFTVSMGNDKGTFDSFECAISVMAPKCSHCGCSVIGHGVEVNGNIYCCVHCSKEEEGHTGLKDRA